MIPGLARGGARRVPIGTALRQSEGNPARDP